MKIGVPKEIKNNEFRVSLTPASVKILVDHSHDIYVQSMAGDAIGFTDNDYLNSGAVILNSAKEIFDSTTLIVKVKEPMPKEFQYINETHTLFTYLHLAGEPEQAAGLVATGATGIAYETVTAEDGSMPHRQCL